MVPRGLFQIEACQERETCSILLDSSHYEPPLFLSACPLCTQLFHFILDSQLNKVTRQHMGGYSCLKVLYFIF